MHERPSGALDRSERYGGIAHVQDQILTQLGAALVQGSLTDEALLVQTEAQPVLPILPDANVVKIGGQSFIDRGRAAVFPLIDELLSNLVHHKIIISTGAGTRAGASADDDLVVDQVGQQLVDEGEHRGTPTVDEALPAN